MSAFEPVAILVQALGWCLLHFVWQAALVGVSYAAARMVLPRGNPRYVAAMAAMVLLAVLPILTGWYEFRLLAQPPLELGNLVTGGGSGPAAPAVLAVAAGQGWLPGLRAALPWLVLAWGCGVALLALRVVRQWRCLRAIVGAAEASPVWQERARLLGQPLGLRHAIRLLASARIATPTLVGWLRPVVVVPLAMLARMPTEQVDLILVHELAHLRRLDHLANLFQVVVETLLFYHPVVHWISRDARNERELCCDALALRATGGRRRDFVAALAGLAEFRTGNADLALAASGGVLAERAWFIAGAVPERRRGHVGLATIGLALLGIAMALGVAWRQEAATRIDRLLADNAAGLRHRLGGIATDLAAPVWLESVARRPEIAPVTLAIMAPPDAKGSATLADMRVAPIPAPLEIADLGAVRVRLAAVVPVSASPSFSAPHALHTVAPVYPRQAMLAGTQGRVEVEFTLDAAGVPRNLRVVDSPASGLLETAALQALSRWRFAAPEVAGRRYRQIFTFRLRGSARELGALTAQGCIPATGSHICRHPLDAAPDARGAGQVY